MCGVIAGIRVPDLAFARGVSALRHRGPDALGASAVGDVMLGHTRLAVQDLDHRSDQPFHRGDLVMSYNGELWGAPEIRALLEGGYGRVFETPGDTEVMAEALRTWGTTCLPRLQGMFAVAWTTGDGVLYAARDRFGEVPLHFHRGAPFMVASEVKALVAAGADPRRIEWVPPGCVVRSDGKRVEVTQWYDPPAAPTDVDPADAATQVGILLANGVLERAVSDVPVCTLLSGGIDSAAVALHLKRTFPDLVAYTAVFDPKSADLRAARVVAEALEVDLREVVVPTPTLDGLREVVRAIEMPHKAQV